MWMDWALAGVATVSALVWVAIALSPRLREPGRHRLPHHVGPGSAGDDSPGEAWPAVAIVVPGRDEAAHLPVVLPALTGQRYAGPLRVVFIDDASTDATPALVAAQAHPRLLPVRLDGDPPAGWVGKCHAVWSGMARLAEAEAEEPEDNHAAWLCFTDADIVWHPNLLRCAVVEATGRGGRAPCDVLALAPTLEFGSAVETVVQLQLVLALALFFPFSHAMDPRRETALTGGAFILVRREIYDAVGGHAAVRDQVVEDLELGRLLKRGGARMRVALAGELQRCRMYDGWQDMSEGLSKNVAAGLRYSRPLGLALLVAVWVCNVSPPLVLLAAGARLALGADARLLLSAALALALLAWSAQAWCFAIACRITRVPGRWAWSAPLGSAIYSMFLVKSFADARRGGNAWKGRRYAAEG